MRGSALRAAAGLDGETAVLASHAPVWNALPMRSSIGHTEGHITAQRRCLVCDFTEEVREPAATDAIGPPCSQCHAPSERVAILARHAAEPNPHAAALGRLGGLKGGPARAAALTARRRRDIARAAARARWARERE